MQYTKLKLGINLRPVIYHPHQMCIWYHSLLRSSCRSCRVSCQQKGFVHIGTRTFVKQNTAICFTLFSFRNETWYRCTDNGKYNCTWLTDNRKQKADNFKTDMTYVMAINASNIFGETLSDIYTIDTSIIGKFSQPTVFSM